VTRRRLLIALGAATLSDPLASIAQQKSMPRVGILSGRSRQAAIDGGIHGAFLKGLQDLGYVEGRTVHYEWRFAGGQYKDLRRMAEELVGLKVDVIVAEGTSSIGPAKEATGTIPIVMTTSGDPVGAGFVASLARPRGNITGLTSGAMETALKRLELLVAIVPGLTRVAVLANQNNPRGQGVLREAQSAARQFNLQVVALHAATPEEIEAAFSAMTLQKAEALLVPTDALFNTQRRQIVRLAAKARVPTIYATREFFDAGGLLVYGHDVADLTHRAAAYVDKILKGAKPGDLPVQQPGNFELLINVKTAKALGVTIPQSLLMRANEAIH
jgi:putative ABC transport system substrate-binding protein